MVRVREGEREVEIWITEWNPLLALWKALDNINKLKNEDIIT